MSVFRVIKDKTPHQFTQFRLSKTLTCSFILSLSPPLSVSLSLSLCTTNTSRFSVHVIYGLYKAKVNRHVISALPSSVNLAQQVSSKLIQKFREGAASYPSVYVYALHAKEGIN